MPAGFSQAGMHFPDPQAQFWVPYVPPPPDCRNRLNVAVMARLAPGVSLPCRRRHRERGSQSTATGTLRALAGARRNREARKAGVADALRRRWASCCSSPASMSPTCYWRARRRANGRSRFAVPSARREAGSFDSCSPRARCSRSSAACSEQRSPLAAFGLLRVLATSLNRRDLARGANLPRLDQIGIDGSVLAFTVGVALVAGLLFGLIPAIQQSRQRDADLLREKQVSHRIRGTLVVAEIAMAVMLLVGGALLIHSFLRLSSVERGYNPTNVLTFQAAPLSSVARGQPGVRRSPRLRDWHRCPA